MAGISSNPLKAIRAMCNQCMGGGQPSDLIKDCVSKDCALHPFRLGKNPFRKPPTEAQIESSKRTMAELRQRSGA